MTREEVDADDIQSEIKLGDDVAKEFFDDFGKSLGLFRGHVLDIDDEDEDDVLYSIIYEDGDGEDMNEEECRSAILLYKQLESGDIKEWEIGGDE